jgi:hypothetical protein
MSLLVPAAAVVVHLGLQFYVNPSATNRKVAGSTPDGVIEIFH